VLPVAEPHGPGAAALAAELAAAGVRADLDASTETLGKRIRAAELEKVPYVLVFGEREAGGSELAVRQRGAGVETMPRTAAVTAIALAATAPGVR
jgi:threonyl-tRNA synthetase